LSYSHRVAFDYNNSLGMLSEAGRQLWSES